MRDHDEVIKYVLQRAEEIKREEENGNAGAENEKNPTTAKPSGILSGKWIKRITVVASCCVLVGVAWFAASKLGGNKKPVDNPAGTTTTPSGIATVPSATPTAVPSATPTISEEPHGGKPIDGWYVTCENEMEQEYNHGEVIEKRYTIISMIELCGCEVVAGKREWVEVVSIDTAPGSTGNAWSFAWNITVRLRVNDAVDPGSMEFSINPTFKDPGQAEQVGAGMNLKQIIYACNIGQKDYVCLNYIDGLYDFSEKVRQYIDDLNRQGESVEYH